MRLRPYQVQGVQFLLERDSALLADEMGLGKTVQVAVALQTRLRSSHDLTRALVVAPSSLGLNWQRELEAWAPLLSVRRVQGDSNDRASYYSLPAHVLVASYESLRLDIHEGLHCLAPFDVVVLDEAQRIKNVDSDTALACRMVSRRSSWALTGTPIENEVADLLSIFAFVRPGLLSPAMPKSELQGAMRPFFLRRKKADVAREMPPIIVQDVPIELGPSQRAAYEALWTDRQLCVTETGCLGLITELKQICNYVADTGESTKLDVLTSLVEQLQGPSSKLVVFSQYVETLEWLATRLPATARCRCFHGGLSTAQRDQMIATFETQPGPSVLLMSLRAGGVGLNLRTASVVVLFDRWWNPAVEMQAVHRAHRLGRSTPLHVIRFLVVDSIEERIDSLLREKARIFDAVVNGAPSAQLPPVVRQYVAWLLDINTEDRPGGDRVE